MCNECVTSCRLLRSPPVAVNKISASRQPQLLQVRAVLATILLNTRLHPAPPILVHHIRPLSLLRIAVPALMRALPLQLLTAVFMVCCVFSSPSLISTSTSIFSHCDKGSTFCYLQFLKVFCHKALLIAP